MVPYVSVTKLCPVCKTLILRTPATAVIYENESINLSSVFFDVNAGGGSCGVNTGTSQQMLFYRGNLSRGGVTVSRYHIWALILHAVSHITSVTDGATSRYSTSLHRYSLWYGSRGWMIINIIIFWWWNSFQLPSPIFYIVLSYLDGRLILISAKV